MKQVWIWLLVIVSLASCQQSPKGYVLHGEVANMKEGKVYLKKFRNKMFFEQDTADIKDGKFTFTGVVEQPLLYGIATESMNYPQQFFLENVEMNVKMEADGENFMIQGSPQNDIFLGNAGKIYQKDFSIDDLIASHPDSPAAAFYLYRYFTYQLTLDELKVTRSKISPALNDSPYVIDLDIIIGQLEKVQIGQIAPDFTLPDTEGNPVSLSDFRGQYILLDFWAAWCPPCRRENPNVVETFNKYKDKNFTIIGISLDYNKENWLKAIADDKLTWTHVSDLKYWDSEIPALYGVRGIPANMLLDTNGVIIAKNIMGEKLSETLNTVLK